MKASYISYKDTGKFSKLFLDYITGNHNLKELYHRKPDLEGFKAQMEEKAAFPNRAALVEALLEQHKSLPNSDKTIAHIQSLSDNNTYTITTGHQLNLFTGPLYFIYKIVTVLKLVKDLAASFPDKHFVPVYWMATEDHDFEEINHTFIGNKFITWPKASFGPSGQIETSDIHRTVQQYQAILGLSEPSKELSTWVESAYLKHNNLAKATRSLVHSIFHEYGLVIVDAQHQSIKQYFLPYILDELEHHANENLVLQDSQKLLSKGYGNQVTPREINLFYMSKESRNRIILEKSGKYRVLDQDLSFEKQEILELAKQHPERFSPNVVLRPLYQEVILPNLAYVGGGAEVAYWMQLKSVFKRADIPFPILIPRNSALIISDSLNMKIQKMGLSYVDLFKDSHTVKNEYVQTHTEEALSLTDELKEFASLFERIKLRAHKIDPTLSPSTEAVKVRLERALNRLEKKLLKAEKRNFGDALQNIDQIQHKIFPNDILQERIENFGLYYVKYGKDFIPNLIEHFQPLDFKFTILS